MKKILLLILSVLFVAIIFACSQEDSEATLQLAESDLTVLSWNTDHFIMKKYVANC